MRLVVLAVVAILAFAATPQAQTDGAAAAYARGDFAAAFKAFKLLAEQGDAAAQTTVGVMYDLGRATPPNDREAVRWYRKAAVQGHAAAQYNLGGMYGRGEGVAVDLVRAYAWYSLAAANGTAGVERQQALHRRDVVAERLSPEWLARAEETARLWLGEPAVIGLVSSLFAPDKRPPKPAAIVIQQGLAALGYDPGPADGIMGPKTHAAIRAFQEDQALPVTGDVSGRLEAEIVAERQARTGISAIAPPEPRSTGAGIAVSREGHILTSYQVVEGCGEIRIAPNIAANHIASDRRHDLALIKADKAPGGTAIFRSGTAIRSGETVVLAGLPTAGATASRIGITTGKLSAVARTSDSRGALRIAAQAGADQARPGVSGGAVLDLSSHVVGMVVGGVDGNAEPMVEDGSSEKSFAIDARTARPFLDSQDVPYETAPSAGTLAPRDVAAMARFFVVVVECWK